MAVDNKQIATDVLELVGGAENVAVATNCMTRLRLTLKDNSKADVEKIKKVKGVLGCQFAGSQLQVIIGQNVPKVLAEFVAMSGVKQGAAVARTSTLLRRSSSSRTCSTSSSTICRAP